MDWRTTLPQENASSLSTIVSVGHSEPTLFGSTNVGLTTPILETMPVGDLPEWSNRHWIANI